MVERLGYAILALKEAASKEKERERESEGDVEIVLEQCLFGVAKQLGWWRTR